LQEEKYLSYDEGINILDNFIDKNQITLVPVIAASVLQFSIDKFSYFYFYIYIELFVLQPYF
jgi:hypothetical protein